MLSQQSDAPEVERRSYERDPAYLGAVLNSTEIGKRPCIIRSFCVGGVYAVFPEGQKQGAVPIGKIVDIHCAIPSRNGQEILQFSGRVVRSDEQSVGLSFVNPDLVTLQRLQKSVKDAQNKARQQAMAELKQKSKKPARKKKAEKNKNLSILERCNSLYIEFNSMYINHFLKAVDKELLQLAREEKSTVKQNSYFEAQEKINKNRTKISNEYCALIKGSLLDYSPEKIKQKIKASDKPQETTLSLMEEDAFDDWLADTVAIDNLETKYRQPLTELEKRLSVLYGLDIFKETNPYSPGILFRTFQEIIKAQNLEHDANVICYKLFENLLINKLSNLYEAVNKVMVEEGILPVIEYKVKVVKANIPLRDQIGLGLYNPELDESEEKGKVKRDDKDKPGEGAQSKQETGTPAKKMHNPQGATQAKTKPASTDSQAASPEAIDTKNVSQPVRPKAQSTSPANAQLSKSASDQQAKATVDGASGANSASRERASEAKYLSADTFSADSIYGVVGEVRELNQRVFSTKEIEGEYIASSDSDPENIYSPQQLFTVISSVQPTSDDPVRLNETPEQLKKRIFSAFGPGKTLAPLHARVVDVACHVFYSMVNDLHMAEDVRRWVKRLEIPVMKLALSDHSLFMNSTHIVPQVLNKIARLELISQMNDAEQSQMIKQALDWLVNLINASPDNAEQVFSEASGQLDKLLEVQARNYRKNVELVVNNSIQEEQKSDATSAEDPDTWSDEKKLWHKKIHRLNGGEWFVFNVKAEAPLRLRLAWYAPKSGRLVFVDVRGIKNRILLEAELIEQLLAGDTIVLSDANEPAMERAQYSMLQSMHQKLVRHTTHDQLTGLINYNEFSKYLERALDQVKCTNKKHALCVISIDKFSLVSETCGYKGGDQLVVDVAAKLKSALGLRGVLARMEGTEFAMLLEEFSLEQALDFSENLVHRFSNLEFNWKGSRYTVSLSTGLVAVTKAWENGEEIVKAARASCSLAQDTGGARMQLYHAGHSKLSQRNKMLQWISEIDEALAKDRLQLRAQKILSLNNEKAKYEVLLVAKDKNGKDLSIQEFIKAAEWYNKVKQIDRWVVKHALEWMSENASLVQEVDSFALNLSGLSLNDDSLIEFVEEQMLITGVDPSKVCFEITETAGIANLSDASEFIERVKQTGCKFSLDDFGIGMSSYAYLKNLPVDFLKIDGSFVKIVDKSQSDYAVVKSICDIGHFMGKKVIAECVENNTIVELVKKIGVDYVQGYGIEKPLLLKDLF